MAASVSLAPKSMLSLMRQPASGPLTATRAETPDGALTAVLDAALELGPRAVASGFQHPAWLAHVYRHLVVAAGEPACLTVRSTQSGQLLAVLPLYVRREGRLTVARFADCGVSDYNAPLLREDGAAELPAAALVAALKRALPGVDLLALDRMSANPLSAHPAAMPARTQGHRVFVNSVDAFLHARGKKYRKEAERCFRLLAHAGAASFQRAETAGEIERASATLERWQAQRHAAVAAGYALEDPRFSAFYRAVLADPADLGQLFTLTVDGEIIAAVLGVAHRDTFTLLRIACAGDRWRTLSPGRLIVIEAMRWFTARGVTTFDFGMGDYAFKRGFGCEQVPLTDLVIPLTARAIPTVAALRLKSRLRRNQRLRALVQYWRGA